MAQVARAPVGAGLLVVAPATVINRVVIEESQAQEIFVGLLKRTSWGRICGIVVCVISLINIPLGTLIGVMGLFAFVKAKELFGPERITHEEVKTAFKGLKGSKLI